MPDRNLPLAMETQSDRPNDVPIDLDSVDTQATQLTQPLAPGLGVEDRQWRSRPYNPAAGIRPRSRSRTPRRGESPPVAVVRKDSPIVNLPEPVTAQRLPPRVTVTTQQHSWTQRVRRERSDGLFEVISRTITEIKIRNIVETVVLETTDEAFASDSD